MAWFADLTPYVYDGMPPTSDVLNVGWLAGGEPFPTGPVPHEVIDALARLIKSPVNLYRGQHLCELCPSKIEVASQRPRHVHIESPDEAWGNDEIRVSGAGGLTYVAPVLIHHYVTKHAYQPPEGFVAAVLRTQTSS